PQAYWRKTRAKILARRGCHQEAERLAREAVEIFAHTDSVTDHADALMSLAEVLRTADRAEAAVPVVEDAAGLYDRKGNIVSARRARALLVHPERAASH